MRKLAFSRLAPLLYAIVLFYCFAFTTPNRACAAASSGICSDEAWKLVWADEFDKDGPLDTQRWMFDTGGDGWGNDEQQFYTDRTENARIEDGHLRIVLILLSMQWQVWLLFHLVKCLFMHNLMNAI
jgi:hypothetical protein